MKRGAGMMMLADKNKKDRKDLIDGDGQGGRLSGFGESR